MWSVDGLLASNYLPTLESARALLAPDAIVLPSRLQVHVALVQSDELAALNGVQSPVLGGIDLSAINGLAHRSRPVRLNDVPHALLSRPTVALELRLDDAGQPLASGEAIASLEVCRGGMHTAQLPVQSVLSAPLTWLHHRVCHRLAGAARRTPSCCGTRWRSGATS